MKVPAEMFVRLMHKYEGKIPPLFRQIDCVPEKQAKELLEACLEEVQGEDRAEFEELQRTWPEGSERVHQWTVRKKCVSYAKEHEPVLRKYKGVAAPPFMNPSVPAKSYRSMSTKDLLDACYRENLNNIDIDVGLEFIWLRDDFSNKEKTDKEARDECMALIEEPLAIKECVDQLLVDVEAEVDYHEQLLDRKGKVDRLKRQAHEAIDQGSEDDAIILVKRLKAARLTEVERREPRALVPPKPGHMKRQFTCVNPDDMLCDGEPTKGKQRKEWKDRHYHWTLIQKLSPGDVQTHKIVHMTSHKYIDTEKLYELAGVDEEQWKERRPNYTDVLCKRCYERLLTPFYNK